MSYLSNFNSANCFCFSYLLIEVLLDVEEVIYTLYMRTHIFKSLLIVTVHITGNGLYMVHPLKPDMIYEVIYSFLILSMGKVAELIIVTHIMYEDWKTKFDKIITVSDGSIIDT